MIIGVHREWLVSIRNPADRSTRVTSSSKSVAGEPFYEITLTIGETLAVEGLNGVNNPPTAVARPLQDAVVCGIIPGQARTIPTPT
jgi:hypothetical protein